MGTLNPEGKYLNIDIVSQNSLSATKKIMKFVNNSKNGSRVLGVTPGGFPLRQS